MADDLELRPLGSKGPHVTVLGFGAMELRGTPHRRPRPLTEETQAELLNRVLDEGITFIDTSIDYGDSEESIGRHISHRRAEYVLASKVGCPLDHQLDAPVGKPLVHDYSPKNVRAGVEQSLRRLRTDYLDLVQVHSSPALSLLEEFGTLETLRELREQGYVRTIGISSTLPHLDDHLKVEDFETIQVPYSALERDLEERIRLAGEEQRGVIIRGGIAQAGNREKTTRHGTSASWADVGLRDLFEGQSPEGFLLRFVITNPAVTTVIVGTGNPDHVPRNIQAARLGPLPEDIYAEARRRLDAIGFSSEPLPQQPAAAESAEAQ